MNKFLTIDEISEILKISKMTVYRYIKAGKLQVYKLGKEYRIRQKDFQKFLNKIKK